MDLSSVEEFMSSDMFKTIDKKAKKELNEAQENAREDILDAAKMCQYLMGKEDYGKYKRAFMRSRESIFHTMVLYTRNFMMDEKRQDMAKYGAQMMRFITRIEDLGLLVEQVEDGSKRGKRLDTDG